MPDQTINVSFTAPSTWTFDPPAPTMTGSGKVKLKQHGNNQSWTFKGVAFDNDTSPPQFTPDTPADNGTKLDIEDACTVVGTYSFTVTVTADGTDYTSPDPQIVNENPNPRPADM
jgi:hypothetical protein